MVWEVVYAWVVFLITLLYTYVLTVSAISDFLLAVVGPVAPKNPSQAVDTETWISAGLSISGSCRVSISGRISTSEIAAKLRPPRTCDLRTMEVIVSKRLTSPEWVTTGVGPRVARAKADSHGYFGRPFRQKSATTLGSYRSGFRDFIGHFGTTQATGNGYFYGDCRDIGDIGAGANIDRLPMIVIHDP